jgi:hypothetical protein
MSVFSTYLELGFRHILDPDGIDHILFIVALCASYELKFWKRILLLVTAFTLGHCLTLILSGMNLFRIDQELVELIIALTIAITSLQNVIIPKGDQTGVKLKYLGAVVFGLFHGMGFSSYFKALLSEEENLLFPLFSFNLGIELGQICIVAGMLLLFLVGEKMLKIKARDRNLFISGLTFGAALLMILDRT